ncbi:serine O-acetyltransferase [Phaeospirillum tilakii]|uniref:serine O-acetyltransferase n=1 Tax=Phaeospirillum tilakii TaxID=741673 RepID=A0ABW5CEI7_9PROT
MEKLVRKIHDVVGMEMLRLVGPEALARLRADEEGYDRTIGLIISDLRAYEAKDPASRGRLNIILSSRPGFKCVMLHRLAHACLAGGREYADRLSSAAFMETGIDLHPAARIGARLVIDHGWGSVIGETTVIGEDCYILGCAILGARGISNNPDGKRHPTLGDRVEVGGHARLLGNIVIGDDCFIAPYATVTTDIPSRSKVLIVSQLQICHPRAGNGAEIARPKRAAAVRGVVHHDNALIVQTEGARVPVFSIINDDSAELLVLSARRIGGEGDRLVWSVGAPALDAVLTHAGRVHLRMEEGGAPVLVLDLNRLCQSFAGSGEPAPSPAWGGFPPGGLERRGHDGVVLL